MAQRFESAYYCMNWQAAPTNLHPLSMWGEQFAFTAVKHTSKKFNFHIQSALVQKKLVSKTRPRQRAGFQKTGLQRV